MRFFRKKRKPLPTQDQDIKLEASAPPVPSQVMEDAASNILHHGELHHWVDEAVREYERRGGFDDLPGKGKPLHIGQTGDVLNGILHNANYIPAWLTLQHEIRDQIQSLLTNIPTLDNRKIDQLLNEINKKITKYNTDVPSAILQKNQITKENIERQLQKWL